MKVAFFDCFAGAGGDMIVASMLDAGLDADFLREQIASLGLDELETLSIERVLRHGIAATYFRPVIGGHGHSHSHEHSHHHHEHGHGHESSHEGHAHDGTPHEHHRHGPHRSFSTIRGLIEASGIAPAAKASATAVFERLGRVEAAIHGTDLEKVHFHEVGAVDSIVDIVAACVGLHALEIERVSCSALAVGGGTVLCEHGLMPVPAPATARLLQEAGVPFHAGPTDRKELLTPTAAAILTHFASEYGGMPSMRAERIGYGAGTMDPSHFANVLRLTVGEAADAQAPQTDTVVLLECNIDDASGEEVGDAAERLRQAGALDVWTEPISMKCSRPAVKLAILAQPRDREHLEAIVFEAGLTLGIRRREMQRSILERDTAEVDTEYGRIRIKQGRYKGRVVSAKPEYGDCAAAAGRHNAPLRTVQQQALQAYRAKE